MRKRKILAGSLVLLALTSLGAVSATAQDRNPSGGPGSEVTQIQVLTTAPVQMSKTDILMNSEASSMPSPEVTGNRDADIETYRQGLYQWAKTNPAQFQALDEATRDLFNNQQFAVLFDQAVNRVKGNTQTEK